MWACGSFLRGRKNSLLRMMADLPALPMLAESCSPGSTSSQGAPEILLLFNSSRPKEDREAKGLAVQEQHLFAEAGRSEMLNRRCLR